MWTIDQTKILSREEIALVLSDLKRKAKRSRNTWQNLVIFRLATCCGLRVSEICGLELRDVKASLAKPYIEIRKAVGKAHKPRRVPLWWDGGTLADLSVWSQERSEGRAPFVSTQANGTRKALDRRNARKRFISTCRVLGPERQKEITIHTGRHSFVSHALAAGRTLAEVRDAAGHANISTTSLYAHIANDDGPTDIFAFEETP